MSFISMVLVVLVALEFFYIMSLVLHETFIVSQH